MTHKSRVSPFGYPWIKACSRLPMAFRSVPRPSSPLDAKASAKRPSLRFNFALGSTSCNDSAEILQVRLEPIRKTELKQRPELHTQYNCYPSRIIPTSLPEHTLKQHLHFTTHQLNSSEDKCSRICTTPPAYPHNTNRTSCAAAQSVAISCPKAKHLFYVDAHR